MLESLNVGVVYISWIIHVVHNGKKERKAPPSLAVIRMAGMGLFDTALWRAAAPDPLTPNQAGKMVDMELIEHATVTL